MDVSKLVPFTPQEYDNKNSKTMYRSLCVPSTMQSYSLAITFMKEWFLNHFKQDMFKAIYIEGKHIMDEYRAGNAAERLKLKKPKPSLAIQPSFNWDFDDENIDSYPYGLSLYSTTGRMRDSFFNDPVNDINMGIGLRALLMQFRFMIRVETRAQQMDLYNYMKISFKHGFSEGHDLNLDFHIPYELMLQVAKDAGFEIVYNEYKMERIRDVSKFLNYINRNSSMPFMYKHRNLNGQNEFFIRMKNMYTHIKSFDLSADDGEREGHLMTNFTIEMTSEVRFPAPKMYAYYSSNEHNLDVVYSPSDDAKKDLNLSTFYSFRQYDLPQVNIDGWHRFLTTSYEEEDRSKPLSIELGELFEGDIIKIINHCDLNKVSPAVFLDIKLINNGKDIGCIMDWEHRVLTTKEPVSEVGSFIAIYADLSYINNINMLLDNDLKSRVQEVPLVGLREDKK